MPAAALAEAEARAGLYPAPAVAAAQCWHLGGLLRAGSGVASTDTPSQGREGLMERRKRILYSILSVCTICLCLGPSCPELLLQHGPPLCGTPPEPVALGSDRVPARPPVSNRTRPLRGRQTVGKRGSQTRQTRPGGAFKGHSIQGPLAALRCASPSWLLPAPTLPTPSGAESPFGASDARVILRREQIPAAGHWGASGGAAWRALGSKDPTSSQDAVFRRREKPSPGRS